jgi:hypothetical protein
VSCARSQTLPRPVAAASFLQQSARSVPCRGKGEKPGTSRRAKCRGS